MALGNLPDDGLADITVEQAQGYIWGYAVGIDMTRRDLQAKCKEQRRPWEIGKGFDYSAPCGTLSPVASTGHLMQGEISLLINGQTQQSGNLNQLIWKVPEVVSYLSGLFKLHSGDLIMTGTPSGVGPVQRGDTLTGRIEGLSEMQCKVI